MKTCFALCANAALLSSMTLSAPAQSPTHQSSTRWTETQANEWYAHQPWLVGSDYIPSNAINQLEMWQADTFDP